MDIFDSQMDPYHIRLDDTNEANEDGLRLLGEIQKLGEDISVIVITGYPSINTVRKALRDFEAFEYVEKYPADGSQFNLREFRQTVRKAVYEAQRQRPTSYARARS